MLRATNRQVARKGDWFFGGSPKHLVTLLIFSDLQDKMISKKGGLAKREVRCAGSVLGEEDKRLQSKGGRK